MVSIKTGLTLGALLVGVVLFFGAGGFKGVGTKIGGFFGSGLSDFSSSVSSAFTGGLFGGQAGASNVANAEGMNQGNANDTEQTTTSLNQFLDVVNPIKSQLSILQLAVDAIKDVFNFGQQAFGSSLSPSSSRNLDFAVSQLRAGQTIADITIKPRQGTAVSRTGMSFISNLGGRERAFGSQESLNSFVERFNR